MDDQTWKKTSKLHLVPFQSVSLLHAAALMLQAGTFRCSNGETYRQKVIVQWILATLELVTAARRPDTSFFSQWLNITDNSRKSVHLLTYLWLALCRRELCGDEPRTYSAILTPRGFASDVCDVSSTPLPAEKLPGLLTDVATAHNKQSLKATPHRPRLIGHALNALAYGWLDPYTRIMSRDLLPRKQTGFNVVPCHQWMTAEYMLQVFYTVNLLLNLGRPATVSMAVQSTTHFLHHQVACSQPVGVGGRYVCMWHL